MLTRIAFLAFMADCLAPEDTGRTARRAPLDAPVPRPLTPFASLLTPLAGSAIRISPKSFLCGHEEFVTLIYNLERRAFRVTIA
jgi:hypothetical protein